MLNVEVDKRNSKLLKVTCVAMPGVVFDMDSFTVTAELKSESGTKQVYVHKSGLLDDGTKLRFAFLGYPSKEYRVLVEQRICGWRCSNKHIMTLNIR